MSEGISTPNYERMQAVREDVLAVLASDSTDRAAFAVDLERAAEGVLSCAPDGDIGRRAQLWRAFGQLLDGAAKLARWDVAIETAESDADRFIRAAKRSAEKLQTTLPADEPVFRALVVATAQMLGVSGPGDLDELVRFLSVVSLPLPLTPGELVPSETRATGRARQRQEDRIPTVACLLSVEGTLIVHAAVVKPGRMYRVDARCRLTAGRRGPAT